MSRSYKKSPNSTDGSAGTTKRSKRVANKKVRITEDVPSGGAYKKVSETWDIHDYSTRWTWEEAVKDWEEGKNPYLKKEFPTLEEYRQYWEKCCKRK